jgi:hypothetical protein
MGLDSRRSSGAPIIPPPSDYIANENIREENMRSYEPDAKRQRRVEVVREVQLLGGAIERGAVPLHIKRQAEKRAAVFVHAGLTQYTCMHNELAATTALLEECSKECHKIDLYDRDDMQLCHKWSINDQTKHGFWGSDYDDCGKLVSNRNREIALCCKRCHITIDSLLRGNDAHEVVQ